MLRSSIVIAMVLTALALIACSDDSGAPSPTDTPAGTSAAPSPTEAVVPNTPVRTTPIAAITPQAEAQAAIAAAEADLDDRLENVDPAEFVITGLREEDWPDSCLGAGEPDEVCATVITPGWEIVIEYADTAYTYRTNTDGTAVRFAGLDIRPGAPAS
jgi:hypothetical protein